MVRGLALPGFDYGPFLVLALHQGVFPGFSEFPPSKKNQHSEFQFDQDKGPRRKPAKVDMASSLKIVI